MRFSNSPEIYALPYALRVLRRFDFPFKLGILERLFGRFLAQNSCQWVKCWNGIIWKLDLTEPCHRWIVYGKYEGGQGLDLATEKLREGGVLVDSGANIGQWLLYLGMLEKVHSLAFEPVSSQREWLKDSLALQSEWDVEVLEYGLSDKFEKLDIQIDAARSTLQLDWFVGKNLPRETVQLVELDEVLRAREIEKVDFWKLDVEGAELKALRGARHSLQNQIIKMIYFECNPGNYSGVCELLQKYGYQISSLCRGGLQPFQSASITRTQDLVAQPRC